MEGFEQFPSSNIRLGKAVSEEALTRVPRDQHSNNIPTGWFTRYAIAKKVHSKLNHVGKIAEQARREHPEWFRKYVNLGRHWEYCSPELVVYIVEELQKAKLKRIDLPEDTGTPVNWETNKALARMLNVNPERLHAAALEYKREHPDWFRKYYSRGNSQLREHYSPELIDKLKDEIRAGFLPVYQQAPENWLNGQRLGGELKVAPKTVKRIADSYKKIHPQYFQECLTAGTGKPSIYYHPALCDIIRTSINERNSNQQSIPEGWLSSESVAKLLVRDVGRVLHVTVQKTADRYRIAHPEWFRRCDTRFGHTGEYYSPQLCLAIQQEISNPVSGYHKVPDGWRNAKSLVDEYNRAYKTIYGIVEQFRQHNPEWFAYFLPLRTTKSTEYYAPELVKEIKRIIDERDTIEKHENPISPQEAKEEFDKLFENP